MSMTWDGGGSASPQAATEPVPAPVTDVLLRRVRDREAFERFMWEWAAALGKIVDKERAERCRRVIG